MPVAHGGVGDQNLFLRVHPVCQRLWPFRLQQGAGAWGGCLGELGNAGRLHIGGRSRAPLGFGVPVHRYVSDIGEHAGAAIALAGELEQLRRGIDEPGGIVVGQKDRVFEQILNKGNVGGNPADAELAQGAIHASNGLLRRLRVGGQFNKQRVIMARDHAAGIGCASIKANAHASGLAKRGDAPVIGDEVILRVLGGDARLQRMPIERHILLAVFAGGLGDGFALGNQNLRLHNVDAGDLFGHGVFYLHARVDLDEIERPAVHIHQKFHRACALIAHMLANAIAQMAQLCPLRGVKIGGGCALHHLLIAPLHRAIALIEVIHASVLVAKDLDLYMAGARDHLFQIARPIAEGGFGLAAPF